MLSGTTNINGGTLDFTDGVTMPNAITLNGGIITSSNSSAVEFNQLAWTSGRYFGSGSLNIPATQTLSLTGSGSKSLGSGATPATLNIAGTAAMTAGIIRADSVLTSNVNILAGGVWDMQGNTTFAQSQGDRFGLISNAGTFRKSGSSTGTISDGWTLNNTGVVEVVGGVLNLGDGALSQTGGIVRLNGGSLSSNSSIQVASGRLEGNGTITASVFNDATIAPGLDIGMLNIASDLTLGPQSILDFDIGGVSQGTQFDLLSENGTVALALNGTLALRLANGFRPNQASVFTILTSNLALTGGFTNVANGSRLTTADGLSSFVVSYGAGSAFSQSINAACKYVHADA